MEVTVALVVGGERIVAGGQLGIAEGTATPCCCASGPVAFRSFIVHTVVPPLCTIDRVRSVRQLFPEVTEAETLTVLSLP